MSVGGHWYTQDGEACHFQEDGKATNLRHARKQNLVPSVTTVLKVVAQPGLERWIRRQDILTARDLASPMPGETDSDFINRVQQVSRERLETASTEGDAIHKAIESAFRGEAYDPRHQANVMATQSVVAELFPGVHDWQPEVTFAHPDGFGGTVDLHSPSTGAVVDYKTKDGDLSGKLAYDQYIQIAAYGRGLDLPRAPAANIFVSRDHPGMVRAHMWSLAELERGRQQFFHSLALWKLTKNYESSFSSQAVAA